MLRHSGEFRHLDIGRGHARTEVICFVRSSQATVITTTGEVLGEYAVDPDKDYKRKAPEPAFPRIQVSLKSCDITLVGLR